MRFGRLRPPTTTPPKLNRKFVHVSIGLVFMLCWPLFRELLKGPLYYATTITLACVIYWRASPISIAAICNLCAGDGLADIIGSWFGSDKIPYNRNKSVAGSVAMVSAGFLASVTPPTITL
ncbi:probable phytol kinase 3, chloroplastic isoform X2 [Alnus glutinosa]|uniref:probable phytol kinase 3, chloroplastic isoform X2 n=1 Tax=Alnus glutinosa TaxID=3517 RepID=UPI002D78A6AB|nr:probable phytol kinase 3, chloroplastic isoform X2 [Alnus glutinosa]